jgi:hypothetical protein
MDIVNYDNRVKFINNIYSKDIFIKYSYRRYIITKRIDYACNVLVKTHFELNKIINRELKSYFNGIKTKKNAEKISDQIFQLCVSVMNQSFNSTFDFNNKNKKYFDKWLQDLYLTTPDNLNVSIEALRNSTNIFQNLIV